MKKIVLFVSLFIFMMVSVSAKENKLYFVESDGRLYYDNQFLDENVFMQHTDMLPGESYSDELIIENGTNTPYTLYFKAVPREQSIVADNLLENITMKITLDGNVVYNGKATGIDYNDDGISLLNAMLIGEIAPSKSSKMVVDITLSSSYQVPSENDLSYIDWNFYAQYGKEQPDVINPKTFTQGDNMKNIIIGLSGILGIGAVLIVLGKKRRIISTTK